MSADNEVIVVRFNRRDVGPSVPHDKIYFFTLEARALIPKLFQFALVLPVDVDLVKVLRKQKTSSVTHRKHLRDDENQKKAVSRKVDFDAWWDSNIFDPYKLRERVAVVPILVRKRQLKLLPRYLATPKWHAQHQGVAAKPAISEYAYLSTRLPAPNDRVRPICSFCPRALLQLQGECTPGQVVCYSSLDFSKILGENDDASVQQHDG